MGRNTVSHSLSDPLDLPCGAVFKNRLVKSAMSDSLGDGRGNPTATQIRLYERWAEGGVALSLIGEVQVDPRYPEKPGNLVLGVSSDHNTLRELTRRAAIDGAHIWPQLGHAGALAHAPLSTPKGPSPLDIEGLRCDGMSAEDVVALPAQYAAAAAQAKALGFTGVQIHAGHGFLLSQFLSPLFNHRSDAWGGDVTARARIVVEIIAAVREQVGPAFPIGIKMNTSDQLVGGLTAEEGLEVVRILDGTSLDLLEFSGGTYFPGAPSASDGLGGGPYFIDFARRARPLTCKPLVTTGGFKSHDQAIDAVASGVTDAVGLARALVLDPALAKRWANGAPGDESGNPEFPRFQDPPPEGITAWYTQRLTAIGEDGESAYGPSLDEAITAYQGRDDARAPSWRERFG
jgi:2,4-dienoyl-CoA reductase-like NADH-dependent reductase (Old Yellow Enzyme family)